VRKADKVFAALLREGFKPDAITLNTYMSTYAEAYKQDDALEIFDSFPKFGLVPDARSYRILIRMHIRCKNISAAMKAKEEAVKVLGDSYNDGEAYGLLIESWAHRRELVESLKLLEEATDKNIRIHERFIRNLRAQCEKLGVVHPNMPPNSRQWIKNLKEERRKSAKANQRRIEPIRSALFTTK
jgi:tetratricopeptide (TPR) repeat protein